MVEVRNHNMAHVMSILTDVIFLNSENNSTMIYYALNDYGDSIRESEVYGRRKQL